jgi:hypothetical protein
MKFNLRVEYANGTVDEIVASAADFVAFEEKYERSVARLEQELKLIEEEIMNYDVIHSKEEQTLLKLGFKPGQLRDETSQTKRYCDGKLTQTERLGL